MSIIFFIGNFKQNLKIMIKINSNLSKHYTKSLVYQCCLNMYLLSRFLQYETKLLQTQRLFCSKLSTAI